MASRLNPDCDVLANLSGGLDSVYGVWRLLEQGRRPLIHHCHLGGNKRLQFESRATQEALEWFRIRGLTNFEYIESWVTLPPYRYKSRMRDPDLIMMVSGQILRDRPHINELSYFNNLEDTSSRYPRMARSRVNILKYWAHRNNIKIDRPIAHLTKADIVRALPDDLFQLSHWCRFPNSHGEACHRCIPCRKVDAALEGELSHAVQERSPETLHALEASADGRTLGTGNADR